MAFLSINRNSLCHCQNQSMDTTQNDQNSNSSSLSKLYIQKLKCQYHPNRMQQKQIKCKIEFQHDTDTNTDTDQESSSSSSQLSEGYHQQHEQGIETETDIDSTSSCSSSSQLSEGYHQQHQGIETDECQIEGLTQHSLQDANLSLSVSEGPSTFRNCKYKEICRNHNVKQIDIDGYSLLKRNIEPFSDTESSEEQNKFVAKGRFDELFEFFMRNVNSELYWNINNDLKQDSETNDVLNMQKEMKDAESELIEKKENKKDTIYLSENIANAESIEDEAPKNNHWKKYQHDEEIQNYIQIMSSIMNSKRVQMLLALFLLAKYRQDYQL